MQVSEDLGGERAHKLWRKSIEENIKKISTIIKDIPVINGRSLDVGLGDGSTISQILKLSQKKFRLIIGVDISKESLLLAQKKSLICVRCDLEKGLPFKDNSFDIVFSHQVIEHIINLDNFCKELYRVIRPNGFLVLGTENLSSWHNIFAIILGYQVFSNSPSKEYNVANPFWKPWKVKFKKKHDHQTILAIKSLKGLLEVHGFEVIKIVGSGYYPFYGKLAELLAKIDKIHARHVIIVATKG